MMPQHQQLTWYLTRPMAHRGLHSPDNPENTLGAFQAAIAAGIGIECDVHCTLDNRVVVIHDAITTRATGTNIDVTKVNYADLKELRLFKSQFSILTLDSLLAEVAGQVPLFIEIKTGTSPKRSGPLICKLLQDYRGDYAIISFDPRILRWFRRQAPQIIRGQLTGGWRYHDDGLHMFERVILYTMLTLPACKPQFIAHDVDNLRNPFLHFWLRVTGLPLVLWPIFTSKQQATARKLQANSIFENLNTDPYRKFDTSD